MLRAWGGGPQTLFLGSGLASGALSGCGGTGSRRVGRVSLYSGEWTPGRGLSLGLLSLNFLSLTTSPSLPRRVRLVGVGVKQLERAHPLSRGGRQLGWRG